MNLMEESCKGKLKDMEEEIRKIQEEKKQDNS